MLCSSLGSVPSFSNAVNNSINDLAKVPGGDLIQGTPTISYIQWLVERAWKMGYDREGASQLRNALVGTRKWIGTSGVEETPFPINGLQPKYRAQKSIL
ncbi:hypothetical protein HDU77_002237 [Chytriomyces hyalinus]|nr:hypothetical protein HDU77_002237 [Chytriomyces hyalinus]